MVVLLGLWFLGWTLSTTTGFNTEYTFPDALATLQHFRVADLFKYFRFHTFVIQILYPLFFVCVWCVIVTPSTNKKTRTILVWVMLILPYWFLPVPIFTGRLIHYFEFLQAPAKLLAAFFGTRDGEFYEEYGMQFGVLSLIWSIPLALLLMMRYDKQPPSCLACNYPLAGLQGNQCPECGNEITIAKQQANS